MLNPQDLQRLVEIITEEVVAAQVAAIRLQTVNQIAGRMRERAIAEGASPNAAGRVYDLAGIKAAALATRDALDRARALLLMAANRYAALLQGHLVTLDAAS